MKNKTLLIIACILSIISIIIYTTNKQEHKQTELESLLNADQIEQINAIQIKTGSVKLKPTLENNRWVMACNNNFPADVGKIEDLFQSLTDTKIVQMVSSNPQRHEGLGVLKPEKKPLPADTSIIRLYDSDKKNIKTLIMGNARESETTSPMMPAAMGPEGQYIRIDNSDEVYLISEYVFLDSTNWMRQNLISVNSMDIKSITWEFPQEDIQNFSLVRKNATATLALSELPENHRTNYNRAAQTAEFFNKIEFDELSSGNYKELESFKEPMKVTMHTFDGLKLQITFGDADKDTNMLLMALNADYTGTNESTKVRAQELSRLSQKFVYKLNNWRAQAIFTNYSDLLVAPTPEISETTEKTASDTEELIMPLEESEVFEESE